MEKIVHNVKIDVEKESILISLDNLQLKGIERFSLKKGNGKTILTVSLQVKNELAGGISDERRGYLYRVYEPPYPADDGGGTGDE